MSKIKLNEAALFWQKFQANRDASGKPKPKPTSPEQVTMDIVAETAKDDYALYKKTGNGMLIWKIYRLHRKLGLPVPDYVLDKLDAYADGVIDGGDVLVSLELKKPNSKGGPTNTKLLKGQENERNIVLFCHSLRERYSEALAYEMTAKRFSKKVGYVEKTYSKWMVGAKSEADSASIVNNQSLINTLCNKPQKK